MAVVGALRRGNWAGVLLVVCLLISWPQPVQADMETLVDLQVEEEEVVPVLQTLARLGDLNLVLNPAVKGKVSAQLQQVPLKTALDIVSRLQGLEYQQVGNVLVVGTADCFRQGFARVYCVKLQYAKASDVANLLNDTRKDKEVVPAAGTPNAKQEKTKKNSSTNENTSAKNTGRFLADDMTNSLLFQGSATEWRQAEEVVSFLDSPGKQVALEAQVVAISKRNLRDIGIEWEWQKTPTYPEKSETTSYSSQNNTTTQQDKTTEKRDFVWGTVRYGKSPSGAPYEFYYQAKINALVSNGKAEILACPKITTLNGKTAYINIGDSVPIPRESTEQNGRTTVTYDYRDVGIILRYTPQVQADGQITAVVHTEVSTPQLETQLAPPAYRFSKREADTQVRLHDGQTMVIGGLIGRSETKAMSRLPFFAELPVLGALFRHQYHEKEDTEVVIFLTARVVLG
ncbi:secretin N-terminal domain-containing protein [Anaeromusa acidaminophila]|uniref:secretin N-terminal domain-containing protein n=1 Tax=Anaeromusa acidaminophila TaxID=81464 RepID=UPI00038207A4|nr:secretin N-terminal domain-containing protein [Anaeromusa acidaminophila]